MEYRALVTCPMKQPHFKIAGRFAGALLNSFGFAAIVSPWRTVYVLAEHINEPWLRRHEIAHLAQMDRDGWLRFWVQVLWWYFVPGYERSPYELEARSVESDPGHPLIAGYAH
jgi:hypothetical protein